MHFPSHPLGRFAWYVHPARAVGLVAGGGVLYAVIPACPEDSQAGAGEDAYDVGLALVAGLGSDVGLGGPVADVSVVVGGERDSQLALRLVAYWRAPVWGLPGVRVTAATLASANCSQAWVRARIGVSSRRLWDTVTVPVGDMETSSGAGAGGGAAMAARMAFFSLRMVVRQPLDLDAPAWSDGLLASCKALAGVGHQPFDQLAALLLAGVPVSPAPRLEPSDGQLGVRNSYLVAIKDVRGNVTDQVGEYGLASRRRGIEQSGELVEGGDPGLEVIDPSPDERLQAKRGLAGRLRAGLGVHWNHWVTRGQQLAHYQAAVGRHRHRHVGRVAGTRQPREYPEEFLFAVPELPPVEAGTAVVHDRHVGSLGRSVPACENERLTPMSRAEHLLGGEGVSRKISNRSSTARVPDADQTASARQGRRNAWSSCFQSPCACAHRGREVATLYTRAAKGMVSS